MGTVRGVAFGILIGVGFTILLTQTPQPVVKGGEWAVPLPATKQPECPSAASRVEPAKKQSEVTPEQVRGKGAALTEAPSPIVVAKESATSLARDASAPVEMPPLPTPLEKLPNTVPEPAKWRGGNWGPTQHAEWSGEQLPLWRRELQTIREQKKFPQHPADLNSGDVLYAKNLAPFRATTATFSILEVGLHPADQKRAPLFDFFKGYLPQSTYSLFANVDQVGGELAAHLEGNPGRYFKGVTSESAAQEKVQEKLETADIIVGRAADGISGQLEAFRYFFVNMLKPGGVYFIEDIDMNFISTPDTDDCTKTRTLMIDYLRDMISQQMNHDWRREVFAEYRSDPFVTNWVQDCSCTQGGCVVTKKLKPFNRFKQPMVHVSPMPDFAATFTTKRPPPLRELTKQDLHANTDNSRFGPMLRPVKFGTPEQLPLWAIDANVFKVDSDRGGSDKAGDHHFHSLYSKFMAPWREALRNTSTTGGDMPVAKKSTMLEIGLGCDMSYKGVGDPAGGYRLFRQYIPNVEYFVFEYQWHVCLKKLYRKPYLKEHIPYLTKHVHEGDQSKYQDLKNCVKRFGTFDIIIDDGSHVSHMMISTFRELFVGGLNPGGVFVMEDIHTSFSPGKAGIVFGSSPEQQRARMTAVDTLRDMIVSMNYPGWLPRYNNTDSMYRFDEPVMNWVEDIVCSREACAISKRLTPLSSTMK